MENCVVLFLQHYSEVTTDYQEQSRKIVRKNNTVVVADLGSPNLVPRFETNKGIYYFHALVLPWTWLPFSPRLLAAVNFFFLFIFCLVHVKGFWRRKKVLWLTDPESDTFFKLFRRFFDFSLYDMVDYLEKPQNRNSLMMLTKDVDVLCVNSHILYKLYHQNNPHTVLVPQGFRSESFKHFRLSARRQRLGYVGGLNFRLNYALLIKLAQRHRRWQFVFCGPVFDYLPEQKTDIDTLLSLPNVTHIPMVPKHQIPAVIATFKVGLIPYDVRFGFNKNCYPMKVFEYFYAGLPVVSTPIIELKRHQPLVQIAGTVSEWEKALTILQRQPWPLTYQRQQRRLAMANSWERKIEAVYQAINEVADHV